MGLQDDAPKATPLGLSTLHLPRWFHAMQWPKLEQLLEQNITVLVWVLLFLVSGVPTPILVTQIRLLYNPPAYTLWYLYPLYVGNTIAGLTAPAVTRSQWGNATKLFVLDAGGQALTTAGLLLCGPPLYATFYASVHVWTGLISVAVAPPASHPSQKQWAALVLISFGIGVQGLNAWASIGPTEVLGGVFVCVGAAIFGGGAVGTEMYLKGSQLQPMQAAWVFGVEGLVLLAVVGILTAHELVFDTLGFLLFGALVLAHSGHQASWFVLAGRLGACNTTVLKAVQSGGIFLVASGMFCEQDPSQCLTATKIGSFSVVTFGVLAYSFFGASAQAQAKKGMEELSTVDLPANGDAVCSGEAAAAFSGEARDAISPERQTSSNQRASGIAAVDF